MDPQKDIVTERSGRILDVMFNRPKKKNAITFDMYATLAGLLDDVDRDDDVRVVLLRGAGDSFTAGNDIADFQRGLPEGGGSPQERLIAALIAFGKPLVAAVHGAAIGFGTTGLEHCDFVYAGESATFQTPFVNLGLVPEFGSSYSIAAQAGYHAAAELFLLGQPFDARRAAELGIVTRVVPDDAVLTTARETAARLAEKPAGALRAIKRLIKRSTREQFDAAAQAESMEFAARTHSAEAREAFAAFFEKRRPDFTKIKSSAA